MSQRILPLLYLNLGGEMMYIIDQRLIAQEVPADRGSKVLNDIASTTFNRKFIHEIFIKHQPIHSRRVLRAMFDRLAHASIMRLNTESMDKLYELMIMAVKHQFQMIRNPRHLIMVTLNHLDAMQDYATNPIVKKNIHVTYELLINAYCGLTIGQLQSIRYSILNFLQDIRVRVSIFINEDSQNMDGTFKYGPVDCYYKGVDKPGQIIYFDNKGEVMDTADFPPGINYGDCEPDGGLGVHEIGNRGTRQGLNMYANSKVEEESKGASKYLYSAEEERLAQELLSPRPKLKLISSRSSYGQGFPEQAFGNNELAKEELNLLARLIGTDSLACQQESQETFRINLFDPEPKEAETSGRNAAKKMENVDTLEFDLKASGRKQDDELSKIIGEMNLAQASDNNGDDDLLALMDQAQ